MGGDEPARGGEPKEKDPAVIEAEEDLERLVLVRLLRFNAIVFGVVTGLIAGLTIFLLTVVLLIKGGEVVGPHLAILGEVFLGYEVTFPGALIGLLYGMGSGFIAGYVFARVYNRLAGWRERRRSGA